MNEYHKQLQDSDLKWVGIDLSILTVGARGGRVRYTCDYCGNEAEQTKAWFKRTKNHFCGKECARLFQVNIIKKNCKICGSEFGVRPCEQHKFSTCENPKCRKEKKVGKNNPNYRHGRAFMFGRRYGEEYEKWRSEVFKRDDFTCQTCGKRGGDLEAHHIRPWAYFKTLRYEPANGVTLCLPCHKKTYRETFVWRKKIAERETDIVGVDLDKTLAAGIWPEPGIGEPLEGALDGMKAIVSVGLKPIIYTARPWSDYENIERWLNDHKMPFSRIVCGKALLLAMIDDRNIEFKGDWKEVVEKVKQL